MMVSHSNAVECVSTATASLLGYVHVMLDGGESCAIQVSYNIHDCIYTHWKIVYKIHNVGCRDISVKNASAVMYLCRGWWHATIIIPWCISRYIIFMCVYYVDIEECSEGNGGCEHTCTELVGSFQCNCQDGFILADDQRTCFGTLPEI